MLKLWNYTNQLCCAQVDDFGRFSAAYSDRDFAGFSVTIPHKVRAIAGQY